MGTAIESGIFALAGTVVGGLISFTTTAWAERRRSQEARAFRNHTERVHTAAEYLAAFDSFRRGIRENDPAYVELARTHAATIERIRLFFDEPVVKAAESAGQHLLAMKEHPSARASEEKKAIDARDETTAAMRKQLGERSRNGADSSVSTSGRRPRTRVRR